MKFEVTAKIRVMYVLENEGNIESYYPKYEIEADTKEDAIEKAYNETRADIEFFKDETEALIYSYFEYFAGTEAEFYNENYIFDYDVEIKDLKEVK